MTTRMTAQRRYDDAEARWHEHLQKEQLACHEPWHALLFVQMAPAVATEAVVATKRVLKTHPARSCSRVCAVSGGRVQRRSGSQRLRTQSQPA